MVAHSLKDDGFDASEDGTGRGTPLTVAFAQNQLGEVRAGEVVNTLNTNSNASGRNTPMIAFAHAEVMPTMQNGADTPAGHNARSGNTKDSYIVPVAFHENQRAEVTVSDTVGSLKVGGGKPGQGYPAVAFTASEQANSYAWERDVYPTLNAQVPNDTSNIQTGIRQGLLVRRLTPRECERLQGFSYDYTLFPLPLKSRQTRVRWSSDGSRYKALGNSMAVPVMRWIGERILAVDDIQ